jgi:hypothetical protein
MKEFCSGFRPEDLCIYEGILSRLPLRRFVHLMKEFCSGFRREDLCIYEGILSRLPLRRFVHLMKEFCPGFRSELDEICAFLGYFAASSSNFFVAR